MRTHAKTSGNQTPARSAGWTPQGYGCPGARGPLPTHPPGWGHYKHSHSLSLPSPSSRQRQSILLQFPCPHPESGGPPLPKQPQTDSLLPSWLDASTPDTKTTNPAIPFSYLRLIDGFFTSLIQPHQTPLTDSHNVLLLPLSMLFLLPGTASLPTPLTLQISTNCRFSQKAPLTSCPSPLTAPPYPVCAQLFLDPW